MENGLEYGLLKTDLYGKKYFPSNDEVANELNRGLGNSPAKDLVGALVFSNPAFWIWKGIFSLIED